VSPGRSTLEVGDLRGCRAARSGGAGVPGPRCRPRP
jgi:hypothetical protein